MTICVGDDSHVALYDSVNGWAFGPVFESAEHAEDFLAWLLDKMNAPDASLIDPLFLSPQGWKAHYEEWFDERVDSEGQLIEAGG